MIHTIEVATSAGSGRLHISAPDAVTSVLLVGGGASGQIDAAELIGLAEALPTDGVAVVRYELPWRVAGKKMGPRPPASDGFWLAGLDAVRATWPGVPVFSGGRSAGARIACRTWDASLAGVVALSYPLHPPGKPEKTRLDELVGVGVPVLLVSGAKDPFGSPAELEEGLAGEHAGPRELVIVPGATHSFPAKTVPMVVEAVRAFVAE